MDQGRRRHYGTFYGLHPLPADGRPVVVVHGNCQAEALRVLLTGQPQRTDGGSDTGAFVTVRIPPVHELFADDLPFLYRLLSRTDVLLSQPVRDDYRDLPLGTAQLAGLLPPGARVLRYPIVRYLGLHPYQAIVRHPDAPSAVPDLVPYHDLRLLTAIRDGLSRPAAVEQLTSVSASPAALRAVAQMSLDELARREKNCDVGVSDAIPALGVEVVHTINHPGNELLIILARRIEQALGVPATAADPGRVLLGGVRAPIQAQVLAALGLAAQNRGQLATNPHLSASNPRLPASNPRLPASNPRLPASNPGLPAPNRVTDADRVDWLTAGTPVTPAQIVEAHSAWYAAHPSFVGAGLTRHAERLALLES